MTKQTINFFLVHFLLILVVCAAFFSIMMGMKFVVDYAFANDLEEIAYPLVATSSIFMLLMWILTIDTVYTAYEKKTDRDDMENENV